MVLHTQPSGAVTITPTVPTTPDVVAVAPGELTFTAATWNTRQTVTVSGKTDTDAADTNVSLTHTLTTVEPGDYAGVSVAAVAVTVTDADTAGVTVDMDVGETGAQTTALAVTEGATGVYTLALATQPSDPVTLALTATPAEVGVAPDTLTFAAAAWNTAQTVTVSGTPDDDPDDETVTLAHTLTTDSTGDYAAVTVADVTVQVTDDEVVVGFEATTQSAAEDAGPASVCVRVTNPQAGETLPQDFTLWLRTVDGVATDGSAAVAGTDYTEIVDQDAGPFTATTRRQCAALEVLDNAVDAADKTLTLELDYRPDTTTPDPNDKEGTEDYVILSPGTLTFTITDDDVQGVTVDTDLTTMRVQATTLSVSEDGTMTETYAVVLATQPTAPVTISAADAPDRVDLTPAGPLVFTATTWATAQTVTGTPDDRDATTEAVTLTHTLTTAATGDYAAESVATVTVTEDDTPGLLVTPTALALQEAAGHAAHRGTYTLALNTQPGGPVTVRVDNADDASSVTANGVGAGATLSLVFAANVWNTAQTVTVAAQRDADAVDATVTLTHDPGGAEYAALADVSLTFTVTDPDVRGIALDADPATPATDEAGPLTVYEAATHAEHSALYTVRLATRPVGGNVTVTLTNSDGDALSVGPLRLVFTPGNWAMAQTVRATARDDFDGDSESVTLTHTAVGGDYPATTPVTADLTVNVTDDDAPELNVSVTTLEIDEPDGNPTTGQYTVRLITEPGGPVTVGIDEPTPNPDIEASPTELTFDASNWATAQPVTVTPRADTDAVNDATTLRHRVTGSAASTYPTSLPAVNVTVTVDDAQTAGVSVSATTLALDEDPLTPAAATYTLVLTAQPTGPVMVTVTSSDADAVAVDTDATPATRAVTFDATSWNTAQAVTATRRQDDNGADERVTLTHTVTGAAEYASVTVPAVTVSVTDDEEPGLVLSSVSVPVNEAATATYTVALATQPTGDVAVRIDGNHADVALQAAG